jgi:hypothetical protein
MDALSKNSVNRVLKYELRDRGITEDTWDFLELAYSISREYRR